MIKWIKRYFDLGFIIHPCCPPDHKCTSPGKIPYDPYEQKHMQGWQNHKQFSLEQWQTWLDQDSSINIGLMCGSPSGLVLVDIDSDEGMVILEESIPEWENTWRFETGRGLRILYKYSDKSRSYKLASGDTFIEVLGDGRQSVLPPSIHPNGREYRWLSGYSPRDIPCCNGEGWVRKIEEELVSEVTSEKENWEAQIKNSTSEGGRNETLTRLAGHMCAAQPLPPSEVYLWLSLYNEKRCNPPLPDKELRTIIGSVSKREANSSEREIREIMKNHGLCRSDAEDFWRAL